MAEISVDDARVAFPLFQEEYGGSIPTSALQFLIRKLGHETSKAWVEKWHYSKRMPTGKNYAYGLYATGKLYAVIVYGIGVNPYQAKYLHAKSVLEIKRMCRSEPKMDYPLSRFIRLTLKMVGRECEYDCVVAFADPEHGHQGTVYKAAGFVLHGTTNSEWHVSDNEGKIRHRRFAFRHARRNGKTIQESRDELGLHRVETKPKFRWVLWLK